MSHVEILESALKLSSEERFIIIKELLKSLDAPDPNLDHIWVEEAERRLKAHREGQLSTVTSEEVFAGK